MTGIFVFKFIFGVKENKENILGLPVNFLFRLELEKLCFQYVHKLILKYIDKFPKNIFWAIKNFDKYNQINI